MGRPVFEHPVYVMRQHVRQLLSFGFTFSISGTDGATLLVGRVGSLKFRDEIRLYRGDGSNAEVLSIRGKSSGGLLMAHEVVDPAEGGTVGSFRTRGLSLLAREVMVVADAEGREVGRITEDSLALGLLRRYATNLIPVIRYVIGVDEMPVCTLTRKWGFPSRTVRVDFSQDFANRLDKRMGLAAGVLLFTG